MKITFAFAFIFILIPLNHASSISYDSDEDYNLHTIKDKTNKYLSKNDKKNVCCHFCRTNTSVKKIKKTIGKNYCNNKYCRNVFCDRCLSYRNATINPCLVCQNNCCCSYDYCNIDHKHCHTYERTRKRHINTVKWKKRKKYTSQEDKKSLNDPKEDENIEPNDYFILNDPLDPYLELENYIKKI